MSASAATPLPAARAAPWSCHPRTTTTISCAPTRAARVHVCINRDALLWQLAALLGEPVDQAIERLQRAMRLSPRDPLMFTMQGVTAFAHFFAGRYEEAISWAEKAFWERPNILATLRVAAASYALAGRLEEARKAVARALELDPDMRLSNLKDRIGIFRRLEDYAKYADALRRAGLPE